jgi:hypothetical protein
MLPQLKFIALLYSIFEDFYLLKPMFLFESQTFTVQNQDEIVERGWFLNHKCVQMLGEK